MSRIGRENCIFSVSFSGIFCPVRPVLRLGSIADRGKGISLFLFGFGIISGRFLTLLFMLFLSARLAVVHLGKIAFHGLQLSDTLFICPVLVVKGVFLGGMRFQFIKRRA